MTTIPLYIASLTRADTGSLSAPLLGGRQGGWLSPNDCRAETNWPRVEGGDSIDPPNTSAQAATGDTTPPADVIDIDQHRHAGD